MRIKEILVDYLIKTNIFEMAFSKADAIKKVSDLQFQIDEHLIKIIMYHDSQMVNHWCNELNAWFHKIQRIKIKGLNKPLSYDILRKILFEQLMESVNEVQDHMNYIYSQYKNLYISEPDSNIVHLKVERLLHYICLDISKNKFTDIKDYL